MIAFGDIRNDGVTGRIDAHYAGLDQFHDETAERARNYRRDRQHGQAQYVELFCEAAGMVVHQLERVALPYSIPVYSGSGFDSLTAKYSIAQRALARNVPTVLLHVGDFDPSGQSIFEAMAEDVAGFVHVDRVLATIAVRPVRVALTAEQVDRHDLPTSPPKPSDARSRGWAGETCQLEALAPDDLAAIVQNAIGDRIDPWQLGLVLKAEERDRAQLLALPPGADDA